MMNVDLAKILERSETTAHLPSSVELPMAFSHDDFDLKVSGSKIIVPVLQTKFHFTSFHGLICILKRSSDLSVTQF